MLNESAHQYAYLDYAATAPLCREAAEVLLSYIGEPTCGLISDANPNSLHSPGRRAFQEMESARKRTAFLLRASRPAELLFTSGATEADCAALLGIATAAAERRFPGWDRHDNDSACSDSRKPQVIVSAIEHEAVLKPAKRLAAFGYRVTVIPPDRNGFIGVGSLERVLDDQTVLVSVQTANSEIGTVQPISELAGAAHRSGALFHTDAVQALGKIPVSLTASDVDAASFSAHKIGGPKGAGLLYLKAGTPFKPLMLGGGQESGKRSGTQNVPAICAFTAALEAALRCLQDESSRLCALRDELYTRLRSVRSLEPTCRPEKGDMVRHLPNIVHFTSSALESETLIMKLDALGFGVSGGSACASTSLEPSHVLTAMGIPSDRAHGALRISMGRDTTSDDISRLITALTHILEEDR